MRFKLLLRIFLYSAGLLMACVDDLPPKERSKIVHTIHETSSTSAKKTNNVESSQPVVSIWVHGTKNTVRFIPLEAIQHFFDCETGLHHKDTLSTDFHLRELADTISQADPHHFAPENFYLFGWSGRLCFKARRQAAKELYTALISLIDEYQVKTGQEPIIRIITHSHGGNVALLLAEMMEEHQRQFHIDELILLACPVQDHTAHLTQYPAFKKIYAIYSSGDLFQIGDPQGVYTENQKTATSFFSRRNFLPFPTIRHAMITYNGRSSTHLEFMLCRFARLLPTILNTINGWYTSMERASKKTYEFDLILDIKR